MSRLEVRPFSEEFVGAAGELLAARHKAHRAAEPLLPPRYEEPAAAQAEVEALLLREGASGAIALRDGRAVGYLLGAPSEDAERWGRNVWVESAGHAVEQAEDLRDLYAAAAQRWYDEGNVRHYALVPGGDAGLVDAWSRLSFGQQHAYGIREVPSATWPEGVRLLEERDVEGLIELAPLLVEYQSQAPVFGVAVPRETEDEIRADILADLPKPEIGDLVFDRDGVIVAAFQLAPVERSSMHTGLARPEGAVLLGWAATRPDDRGSGAGLALTQGAFAWAWERGHEVMVVDWRVTNLLASRFWPARGFRTTFLRLYRHIP